jgi:hypothetical protein
MPAVYAYNAGMASIQYTVRGISPPLDAELRREASSNGKTLNAIVIETLEQAKLPTTAAVHGDLDWFVGSLSADDGAADAEAWLDSLPASPE